MKHVHRLLDKVKKKNNIKIKKRTNCGNSKDKTFLLKRTNKFFFNVVYKYVYINIF